MLKVCIAGDAWLTRKAKPADLNRLTGGPGTNAFVVNLECAVASGPPRAGRNAVLPLDPARLKDLLVAPDVVCIVANNHVTDFGAEGLLATLDALKGEGIRAVGAGANITEARAPVVLEVGGRKVAFLAYAETAARVGAIAATERTPGVAPLEPALVMADLRSAATEADDVWLFLHWGSEFVRYPDPGQRELARTFAEAGATLIVGTHPHVVAGRETMSSTPVYYSLGNFIFPPIPLQDGGTLNWGIASRRSVFLIGEFTGIKWQWDPFPVLLSAAGAPARPAQADDHSASRQLEQLSRFFAAGYDRRYVSMRRKDLIAYAFSRACGMTWRDRARRLRNLLAGSSRAVSARSASGGPSPHE